MADDGKAKLAWRAFPTWDRSPGLRPETVIVAALWGAFLIGMAYPVRAFDKMFTELEIPLPLMTRVTVGTPAVVWVVLGVLVPVALVWRLRRASARAADTAEHVLSPTRSSGRSWGRHIWNVCQARITGMCACHELCHELR